jgi:hypothetical protein
LAIDPVNTPNRDEKAAKHDKICGLGKMRRQVKGAKRSRIQIFDGGSNLSFESKMLKKESVLEKKMPLYRNLEPLHHFS